MGKEIDLIIDQNSKVMLAEIKSGETIRQDFFKGLNYYNKIARTNSNNSYIIYGGDGKQVGKTGITIDWRNIDKIR